MLKCVYQLASGKRQKVGNHEVVKEGSFIFHFFHYWTEICTADVLNKTFKVNHGGYYTSSTTRAINSYREYFTSKGFEEVS